MIEPEQERIRFLAPAGAADTLVERIYLEGGLLWCSRCSRYDTAEPELDVSGEPTRPA
jgi:hypothetical protein